MTSLNGRRRIAVFVGALAAQVAVLGGLSPQAALAQTVEPPFVESYTPQDLGTPPGVPTRFGGLTLKAGDNNTLLIGGEANAATGALYAIGVTRDAAGHITGFTGTATRFADAAYNDGGVTYGPGGVLFLARWPSNELGQTKPGSSATDKIISMQPLGVTSSLSALTFVPPTHPGAGSLKLSSWPGGQWYDAGVMPDGTGTYDVVGVTAIPASQLPGGPEGYVYVPLDSPEFSASSMLVSEYSAGNVAAYEVDADGNPVVATRREFVTGLSGAEGAFIDPVTGDFLFSTFGGGDRVIVVRGFAPPGQPPAATLVSPTPGGYVNPPGSPRTPDLPAPVLGQAFNAVPLSGEVFVSRPAGTARASQSVPGLKGRKFNPLREARQLPVGSLLDTRRGTVRLTSARDTRGGTQSGDFVAGVFQVLQSRRQSARGLTELRLKGASFRRCRARRSEVQSARLSRRTIRRLRANARGRFRTRGRYSAATVRGTTWLTADRCDGTLTRVTRGRVAVRDFRRKKTIILRRGKRYVAKAPPKK